MAFEKFIRESKRAYGPPKAAISKVGTIVLSSSCGAMYVRGRRAVELYYDKQAQAIGLKFLDEVGKDAYKVQHRKGTGISTLSVRGFLQHWNIPYTENRHFPVEWDEKSEMLIIRMGE